MNGFKENTDNPMNNNPLWKLLEDNYNKYYLNYKGDRSPIIPKKIHYIWLGSEFPDKYKRLKETWEKFHTTWEIKIWNDADAEEFGMINKQKYDTVGNIGSKSDIFRYEILHRHGGIYIDTDFECLKSFDDLLYLDFFAGGGWNEWPVMFNGIMACTPDNEFVRKIINALYFKNISDGYYEILNFSGCDFITGVYAEYIKTASEKTVLFPNRFFYPMPAIVRMDVRQDNEESRRLISSYIKYNSYCVHLWYCSWQ